MKSGGGLGFCYCALCRQHSVSCSNGWCLLSFKMVEKVDMPAENIKINVLVISEVDSLHCGGFALKSGLEISRTKTQDASWNQQSAAFGLQLYHLIEFSLKWHVSWVYVPIIDQDSNHHNYISKHPLLVWGARCRALIFVSIHRSDSPIGRMPTASVGRGEYDVEKSEYKVGRKRIKLEVLEKRKKCERKRGSCLTIYLHFILFLVPKTPFRRFFVFVIAWLCPRSVPTDFNIFVWWG